MPYFALFFVLFYFFFGCFILGVPYPILAASTNNLAFLSFYVVPGVTIQAEMIEQHS